MKLLLGSNLYEYDIRGLLQAFFPWEKFVTDEAAPDRDCLSVFFTEGAGEGGRDLAELTFTLGDFEEREAISLTLSDVKTAKSALKRTLYRMLSKATGKTLPWGTLTGIRPTKIAMDILNGGSGREAEVLRHMQEDLLVSERKANLSLEIAKREKAMLSRIEKEGISLYVGVPFCPTTCLYCSFSSFTIGAYEKRVPEYIDAVCRELDVIRSLFPDTPVHSVYFGGGTPTSLSAEGLAMLLKKVQDTFDLADTLEWTVEAGRPDSVTEEKLRMLKTFPVTRISVNPQTLHQKTLDLIGRKHTVEDFYRAYRLARDLGFDNINTDLIFGLPGETAEDMRETIRGIRELAPDSVTVHSLAIKRSSRLNLMKDVYEHYRMENTDDLMAFTEDALRETGLRPYYLYRQKNMSGNLENVGYAAEGKECYYNVLIMEEIESILAAGAGASTKRVDTVNNRITRAANAHDVETYLRNFDEMMDRKRKLFEQA